VPTLLAPAAGPAQPGDEARDEYALRRRCSVQVRQQPFYPRSYLIWSTQRLRVSVSTQRLRVSVESESAHASPIRFASARGTAGGDGYSTTPGSLDLALASG
jgi:hypothetical protein